MRIGLHALGIGAGADPAVVSAVAGTAEACGFSTLWAGEHVVMVDRPDSTYPYHPGGRIALPSDVDWLDPLAVLGAAAAVTSRIQLATGVLLVAEHNPVVLAKQVASLDVLSGGRLVLGVGIGWSAEEFAALGIPFEGRAQRVREHIEAMRTLWADDVSSYRGELVHFDTVRSYPKPVARRVPVVLGGNSDAALGRVARYGDGWYGFNLAVDEVPGRLATLAAGCRQRDRDPSDLYLAVALTDGRPGDLPTLADLGITEVVLVASPPGGAAAASDWVRDLAGQWGVSDPAAGASGPRAQPQPHPPS